MTQPEIEVIRADIDAARERVSNDLDEIGHRLNPHYVKQQVKDSIREATIGRVEDMARGTGNGLMSTIRENPIPAAIAGFGLAWLFKNRSNGSSSQNQSSSRYSGYSGYGYGQGDGRSSNDWQRQNPESSKIDSVRDRASEVGEGVKEKMSDFSEQAQDVVHRVANTGTRQARRVEDVFYEKPLAVGVLAIAAGIAAGLAAPATQAEAKLLGEARDSFVEKAGEVARETSEKAQKVAHRALEETQNAARQEGLVSNA
ncbi:MAG TPA: DUF3618 domain-containing protein [Gemmatimonadaceae bacterium]|nr:DUF3618 domain-containing protein [Gemmatimonadaceae bacterium]